MDMVDFGATVEELREPKLVHYPFGPARTFGDDPEKYRWRAAWDGFDGKIYGISLTAYPVVRTTPCGAWIDKTAYWAGSGFHTWEDGHSWVSNNGNQAWAKRTQEEAVQSLAIRLCRWSAHISRDAHRALQACDALTALRPDLKGRADTARFKIEGALK